MKRLFALILVTVALTGCSELKVIGAAAMREIKSEGYNVEQISYNYHQKLAASSVKSGVLAAKSDILTVSEDGRMVGSEKKLRLLAKPKKVRGLWEKETARLEATRNSGRFQLAQGGS